MGTSKKMIGILAGMGPKSTGPFVTQVISSFQALTGAINDIDFPPMMIYSLPTPFYVDRPIDHALMKQTICSGVKKLEDCGAAFIAMPCNTAHLYYAELQKCIQIPLLNMVEATLKRVPRSAKKIAILATRPTFESEVYQRGLHEAGLHYVAHPDWQERIDAILFEIKTSIHAQDAIHLWERLAERLHNSNVDTILLTCTDLNVLFEKVRLSFQIVDSSVCLAEAIVREWLY